MQEGRVRSGLASHGIAPAVLSGAVLGHDRVRDGTGWVQNALGHGHDPLAHTPGAEQIWIRNGRSAGEVFVLHNARQHACADGRRGVGWGCCVEWGGDPPSAMSTGRLRSVTSRPPPASQPGRLPGAFLLSEGETRLAVGFPLRCFQRFAHPDVATQRCRLPDNWITSGPSTPVLSY